jgi:hypothetical protein
VAEKYFLPNYFDNGLIGAQADQACLKEIIKLKMTDLYDHLKSLDIDLTSITLNWFLAIFVDATSFETLLRIWDCFLLEGSKVLFRFTCALLYMHKQVLLEQSDTISVFKHLKHAVKYTFDVDGVVKIAFETLRPFPRRKDIGIKQTYFLRMIGETWQARLLARNSYFQQDRLHNESDGDNKNTLIIECATFATESKLSLIFNAFLFFL